MCAMCLKMLTVLLLFFCVSYVKTARILGIFPMPSISHQAVFRALTIELAKRGHELVVVTTDPAFTDQKTPFNITEIDSSESYATWTKLIIHSQSQNKIHRGVIMDVNSWLDEENVRIIMDIFVRQFQLPQMKTLIEDKSQKFDLIIAEAMMNYILIAGKIFNAPVIQVSSFYGSSEHFDFVGAPAWHPLFFPSTYRRKYRNLNFWEKLIETYHEYKLMKLLKLCEEIEYELLKENFGPYAPTTIELHEQVQMLFLNVHPIFGNNRPVPPNTLYFSALHLQPVKDVPQDLKSYLDSSSRGVVYVSLGTNVSPSKMDHDFLHAFLQAFEALPYDILWKFDGDNIDDIPKNVKVQKWFPQRDLLMHPKIKLFVTQGGLQSTDEAIDAEVPLVGIPLLVDQWYNVNKYVELGVGVEVDSYTMTAHDLTNAINEVINNGSYKENMKKLRKIMKDQPIKPIDHAVWWIEYVIRHGGAQHLRSPSANKTWSQYYMLDVMLVIASSVLLVVLSIIAVVIKIFYMFKSKSVKQKSH